MKTRLLETENTAIPVAYGAQYIGTFKRPTWKERLRDFIFPYQFNTFPDVMDYPELPHSFGTETVCHFDWKDRIRILFGGVVKIETISFVANTPGKPITHSSVTVQEPKYEMYFHREGRITLSGDIPAKIAERIKIEKHDLAQNINRPEIF
jgi:hypothetical protein